MSPSYAHITGWGMAVPDKILTNHDLAKMVDTSDEWIVSRTGIHERRIARADQSTASLAAEAGLRALQVANLHPGELDMIIVSTSSPEYIFPATACLVQDRIGAGKASAFDLLAACTGFVYAINLGAQAIKSSAVKNVLVIGSETLSRLVNWKDRNTCILFGDGAGAFVIQASEEPGGVLSAVLRSDGSGGDLLSVPGGGSRHPASMQSLYDGLHYIQMNGREVFRFATRVMVEATQQTIESANLTMDDIQLVIPHQANQRIIEAAARGLDYPMDKVMVNLDRFGNTSTASIPIATVEAIEQNRLKPGDNVVMVAFGSGLTWGATLIQWSGPLPYRRKVSPRKVQWFARTRSLLARLRRRIEGILWGRE
ncbi:MAG: ketoacyl-ACP synthase III [Chloroflexota bacterium]|nr:MAG: ketoacyl-ACP synthase III [Chloroflexota bacterium]